LEDDSTPAKSNRSDKRDDRGSKKNNAGKVNFEVEARLLNKELKKYETMVKRLRCDLRLTKEDCANYREKLENAMEETDQLKEALIEAENAAENSMAGSVGSRSDSGDDFLRDRVISADRYDPEQYDHTKLIVMNRKTKQQTEDALGFLQDQVQDMERELEKMREKLGKSAEDAENAENRAAAKDKDMMNLMKSLGDIHETSQSNFNEANKSRVAAEAKVAEVERENNMSRSVNSKLTSENIALRDETDQLQSRLDVTMAEAAELSRSLAQGNSAMNSVRTQLQIEAELRIRSEQKERDERNERISLSAQMVAMTRDNSESEVRLKEEIQANDAVWQQQILEFEATIKSGEENLAISKERISRLQVECSSLKEALLKADGVEEENRNKIEEIADLRGEVHVMNEKIELITEEKEAANVSNKRAIATLEASITKFRKERRAMHNTIQELRGNVRVFARVRPFLPNDNVPADTEPSIVPKGEQDISVLKDNDEEVKFSYDRVFQPSVSQESVFAEVSEFVQSALDGYNVCLFSYGQTGSGKTHTMQGSGQGQMRGIIPRAIEQIGQYKKTLEKDGWKYSVNVSFLEIYNETIRDLLRDEGAEELKHDVKVGPDGRRFVSDITMKEIEPTDSCAIEDIMGLATTNRSVASTDMNEVSSRSHSVFTLYLTATNSKHKQNLRGTLNLVDLAGSERLKRSGVTGSMMKEAMAINKSLSSLTDVFVSIGKKSSHVPFRNSKLTYLLQPSLSGDGKTLMVVNLSPTEESTQESICSLRFAAQVNKCELGQAKRSLEDMPGTGSASSTTPSKRSSSPTPSASSDTDDKAVVEPLADNGFARIKVVSPDPKQPSTPRTNKTPSKTSSRTSLGAPKSSSASLIRKKNVVSTKLGPKTAPKKKIGSTPVMSKSSRERDPQRKKKSTRPQSIG